MSIEFEDIFKTLIDAAHVSFKEHWPVIKDFATGEFDKIATSIVNIEYWYQTEQISQNEASIFLEMQKNAARAVMLALEGMTLIMVEQAINAALKAISKLVNDSIGFALL